MKLNINYKFTYLVSILASLMILIYFAYKGVIAYLIHKELYGGGIDVVISLRGTISAIMLFLILLQIQFLKIKDLNSHKTIISGIFVIWTAMFITTLIISPEKIYLIISILITSLFMLISLFSLRDKIKEERNTLTDKEIYLLQKLAKKK
tara:strand:- start:49 stop:498 length:450 start_codon:yes stop_codon:yes gene_type:complete